MMMMILIMVILMMMMIDDADYLDNHDDGDDAGPWLETSWW